MSGHAAACPGCTSRMDAESDLLARLSSMEPAPRRVKERLLARVEADAGRGERRGWMGRLSALGRGLAAHSAPAVAVTLLVGVVLGGVWYSGRPGDAPDAIARQVAANGPDMIELVDQQLFLDPLGLQPGVSIRLLEGTETDARGVVLVPPERRGGLPRGAPDAGAPGGQGLPGVAHERRRHVQRGHVLRRRGRPWPGAPPPGRPHARPRIDSHYRREVRRQPRTHRTASPLGRHVGNFSRHTP